jgi:hypothetical protein
MKCEDDDELQVDKDFEAVGVAHLKYASTERRGRIVSTPATHSGGPGLEYRTDTGYPHLVSIVFLSPSR